MYNKADLTEFMEKTEFPGEAYSTFFDLDELIYRDAAYSERINALLCRYGNVKIDGMDDTLKALSAFGEEIGVSSYTLHMIYFMYLAPKLRELYRERGIAEEIYWDSMRDLRAKAIECKNVKGVWGAFVGSWFKGFFELTRFALGRLQFEEVEYNRDDYTKNGFTVYEDQKAYNMHIPSLGPLPEESVRDSFKRAYNFWKPEGGEPIVFVCSSWLLFKGHYDFLPKGCNTLKFMDCFDIIESEEQEDFGDGWRVFGKESSGPAEELPEDTSMRRAFKKWILGGNKTGYGFGIIVFDGEKIVNR
ncbi:MAG: acyltransferase domain-containing protein [Oscillospiraceae bacterium]|nr:acyltransferase domain-containing protein [Oscillospiraceae bacterium]